MSLASELFEVVGLGDGGGVSTVIPVGVGKTHIVTPSKIYAGRVVIAVANEPVQFPNRRVLRVIIRPGTVASPPMYLGARNVDASTGWSVLATDSPIELWIGDLSQLFLVGGGVGDSVRYIAA